MGITRPRNRRNTWGPNAKQTNGRINFVKWMSLKDTVEKRKARSIKLERFLPVQSFLGFALRRFLPRWPLPQRQQEAQIRRVELGVPELEPVVRPAGKHPKRRGAGCSLA